MGDDVFFAQPGVPPPDADPGDPLFIGGSGNDTYVLANNSEVIVAEYGSSASDVLVATGMGLNSTTTFVFTIDNRHLAAADTQTGQAVFVLDWQLAANQIETIVLADGTFSFAQIQSAVFSSPNFLGNFTWESLDIGYSTADVNEAIGFYTARGTFVDGRRPPAVTPTSANVSVLHDQSAAASTLFSVSDPDGDPITVYNFFDTGVSSGAFTIGAAPQPANQIITVPAANLPTVAYRAGTLQGAELVYVRAYDGVDWSAWVNWTMTSFNSVPVVTPAANTLVTTGQAVALSSLFSFADADGDALNSMNLYDAGAGGGFLRIQRRCAAGADADPDHGRAARADRVRRRGDTDGLARLRAALGTRERRDEQSQRVGEPDDEQPAGEQRQPRSQCARSQFRSEPVAPALGAGHRLRCRRGSSPAV
jgi:hypothetical protein